jgi:hypothetical protein
MLREKDGTPGLGRQGIFLVIFSFPGRRGLSDFRRF